MIMELRGGTLIWQRGYGVMYWKCLNILAFLKVNLLVSYQLAQAEKEEIILFESHLAAATTKVTITESNSLLLSQLISMDPV